MIKEHSEVLKILHSYLEKIAEYPKTSKIITEMLRDLEISLNTIIYDLKYDSDENVSSKLRKILFEINADSYETFFDVEKNKETKD